MRSLLRLTLALFLLLLAGAAEAQVRIVVLGSSTAEGVGPSSPDSAWVNRYRVYARAQNPANEVINLARGGYTTARLLPTGTPAPSGQSAPDPERNITQALSLSPDAILINMPSNDAAMGVPVSAQLANYDAILQAAGSVPVFISTTQPRNANINVRTNLMAVRDSTLRRYGPRALDFWAGIATTPDMTLTPGSVRTEYDSGDGIHLNNAAHRILFQRAVAANVLGAATSAGETADAAVFRLVAGPSPFRHTTTVAFEAPRTGRVSLCAYDALGRQVAVLVDGILPAGPHSARFEASGLPAGAYTLRLTQGGRTATRSVVAVR